MTTAKIKETLRKVRTISYKDLDENKIHHELISNPVIVAFSKKGRLFYLGIKKSAHLKEVEVNHIVNFYQKELKAIDCKFTGTAKANFFEGVRSGYEIYEMNVPYGK